MSAKRAKFRRNQVVIHRGSGLPVKIRCSRDAENYYYLFGGMPWAHEAELRKLTRREKGDAR